MITSALLVSFSVELAVTWWAFLGFLISHVVFSWVTFNIREWALFVQNFAFIFVDVYAMFIRL